MKTVALVEGQNQLSSTFWLTAKAGELKALLNEPPDGGAVRVRRIKSDVLDGGRNKPRTWNLGADRLAPTASMLQVFEAYVTEIVRRAVSSRDQVDRLWFTIPAVRDSTARLEYHRTLKKAAARASGSVKTKFITEPDAVLQYFRLVDRKIEQRPGELEVYLVLDAGAGTTNISVVFKGKTQEGVGKLRENYTSRGALQPVFAEASNIAGDWVDKRIPEFFLQKARKVGVKRMDAGDTLLRSLVEKDAEKIKVALSTDRPSWVVQLPDAISGEVHEVALTRADLAAVVGEMTGGQVLLEGAVGKGIDPHAARQEQASALAQIAHQLGRIHRWVLAQAHQATQEFPFRHVGGAHHVRLGLVGLVGQFVQQGAHPVHRRVARGCLLDAADERAARDHPVRAPRRGEVEGAFVLLHEQGKMASGEVNPGHHELKKNGQRLGNVLTCY